MDNTTDTTILFLIICILLIICIIGFYQSVISPFIQRRRYIIMEMNRSDGREYRYWKRKLKKLYISCIPILGPIISKKY